MKPRRDNEDYRDERRGTIEDQGAVVGTSHIHPTTATACE
jgi:hypothetical protein